MLINHSKILASMCLANQEIKLSYFLRMVEEVSISDTIRAGLTKHRTLERGFLWVISRMSFKVYRLPKYDDLVFLSTFALKKMRNFFPRYYILRNSKGEKLIEGEAIWCLIDQNTRKIIDPRDYKIQIHQVSLPLDINRDEINMYIPNIKNPTKEEKREVRYSDLDLNGHMTNYRYADWYLDMHDISFFKENKITAFKIAFLSEAKYGQDIDLVFENQGNIDLLLGKNGDNKIFQIEVDLDKRN